MPATPQTPFDRFAERTSDVASKAPFFLACVIVVVLWIPTIAFLRFDAWQLIINTLTSIITFLLVALLQNSQNRNLRALNRKLDAVAEGVADLMRFHEGQDSHLADDIAELEDAVGLERRISASDQR